MTILDENIRRDEWQILISRRIHARQIGHELAPKGIDDEDIIPLLHRIRRPTFFTRDSDFYDRGLLHPGYCLVYLEIRPGEAAQFVRRVLNHPAFDTQAKRMGKVIHVSAGKIHFYQHRSHGERAVTW